MLYNISNIPPPPIYKNVEYYYVDLDEEELEEITVNCYGHLWKVVLMEHHDACDCMKPTK